MKAIKESGINNVFSKTLLTELLSDIDLIVAKARDGLKGKTGSPAVRHFLQEVKDKVKRMIVKIDDKETKVLAESIATKIEDLLKEGEAQPDDFKITDLKESGINEVAIDFISLKEAKFNDDFSEVEVVLIEAGCNEVKKRYYPDKTIREAAPIFSGWKMYINHPTPTEERERPERNLKDWASTIVESRYDGGKAIGRVAIHDTWLRERLADPVARQHIGLSINTGGKLSTGKVNGKDGYQIVEAIIPARKNGPPSVDWVTEAGARGRVSKLLESRYTGGKSMEIENATLKDLKETRQDLVEAIKTETNAGNTEKVTKIESDLKEAQGKIAEFTKKEKLSKQSEAVDAALKEAKIPEVSKERVREHFKSALVEGDLKEAITGVIAKELEFVNKLTGKGKINLGAATEGATLMESLGKDLDGRAGIKETKQAE